MQRERTLVKSTKQYTIDITILFTTQSARLLIALLVLQSLLPQLVTAALTIITQSYQSRPIDQHPTACMLNQSTPERSTLHHASAESVDIAIMLRTQPIAGKLGGNAHGNSSHHSNLIITTYQPLQHAALSALMCCEKWSHHAAVTRSLELTPCDMTFRSEGAGAFSFVDACMVLWLTHNLLG